MPRKSSKSSRAAKELEFDDTPFDNPLKQQADGGGGTASAAAAAAATASQDALARTQSAAKHTLAPESKELDGELAEVETSQDLYDHILEALHTAHGWNRNGLSSDQELRRLLRNVKDWDARLSEKQLSRILEDHLHIKLDADEIIQLSTVTGGAACSIQQFVLWFEQQSDLMSEELTRDPYKLALQKMQESGMMAPTSNFRGNWDLTQAVLLGYIAVMLPYRLGFDDNVEMPSFSFFFDLCVDIYFIVDLFLNFRTAVVTKEGELLYKQRDVAMAYLRGWFIIDFMSCLPLSYAEYFVDDTSTSGAGSLGGLMAGGDDETFSSSRQNKLVRLLRLFRLLKLLRLVRIKRILDRWEEEMYGVRALRVGKLVFTVFACSHWVACGWHFVGDTGPRLGADGVSTIQGWASEMFPDRLLSGSICVQDCNFASRYFTSFFWAQMSTLMVDTTSAVPDSTPELWEEKLVYMISFSLGTLVISIIIGQVSDMIAHANPGEKHRNDTIGMIHGMLHERQISAQLTRRVRAHFQTLYKVKGTTLDIYRDVLALMPRSLGEELATELGFLDNMSTGRRGILAKVSLFSQLESRELMMIASRLAYVRTQMHSNASSKSGISVESNIDLASDHSGVGLNGAGKHSFVMKQGERDDRMFVIVEGMIRVVRSDTDAGTWEDLGQLNLGRLHEGDFMGELAVLLEEAPGLPYKRLRSAFAITGTCVLCTLSFKDVQQLRALSPAIDGAVRDAASTVCANRPSLVKGASASEDAALHGDRDARLDRLERKMDHLLSLMS